MVNGGTSLVGRAPIPASVVLQSLRRLVSLLMLARWVLVAASLAAVLGLHVLTVEHGNHSDLPSAVIMTGPAVVQTAHQVDVVPPGVSTQADDFRAPALPADNGHGWLTGCVLFLALAGASAVLMANARRGLYDPTPDGNGVAQSTGGPQRPVTGVPRRLLCVHRA